MDLGAARLFWFSLAITLQVTITQECLLGKNGEGLPSSEDARDADNRDLISISHQAIIPSYNFTCDTVCGNITQWEVDIRGNGMNRMYTLDLQVWRPSPSAARDPSGSGCYSLVGNNKFTTTLGRGMMNVARFNPSPQDRIQFRPGDVLGFYVDGPGARGPSMNNVRVNALRTDRFTSELVWYGRITSPNSKNGNCPYTVGPNGDLSASTAAAPIISIKLTAAASCPSLMPLATPLPLPPATNDQSLIPQSRTLRFPTTSEGVTDSQISTNIGLIVGIVIAVVALMLSTVVTMIVILLKIFREKAYGFNNPIEGQAISNIVYDTNLKGNKSNSLKVEADGEYYDYIDDGDDEGNPPASGTGKGAVPKEAALYHSASPNASPSDEHSVVRETGHLILSTDDLYEDPEAQTFINSTSDNEASLPQGVFDRAGFYVPSKVSTMVSYPDPPPHFDSRGKCVGGSWYETINIAQTMFLPLLYSDQNLIVKDRVEDERASQGEFHLYEIEENREYKKLEFFVEDQIYWAPASTTSDLYSQLASKKYREIPRNQLTICQCLGSGEFGEVCKAVWRISGATKELAVKTLRPELPEEEKVRFLQEAAIMGQFSHPNVVKLYGVVTVGDPVMICIELLSTGDLRAYLHSIIPGKQGQQLLEKGFLKFSQQIASGMKYLSGKSFVHRDLAARNVLLDGSLNCKIADFGMARDLENNTYYTPRAKGGKIPIKWTAPEALRYKKYSTDSDVWSYGMVLFEIWSVGKKPFSQVSNNKAIKLVKSNYNQPPPPGCPRAIYHLMVVCWNPDHNKRWSFTDICSYLKTPAEQLLQWCAQDCVASEGARIIGAPLSEAESLYQDLQKIYLAKADK